MSSIADTPTFTSVYEDPSRFQPLSDSTYIYRESVEDRSALPPALSGYSGCSFIRVTTEEDFTFTAEGDDHIPHQYSLRSSRILHLFVKNCIKKTCYLDISGLRHHVWAPLLRALTSEAIDTYVVYGEPADYSPISSQTKSWIYQVGAGIKGISPIPGFERPFGGDANMACLVPLLGFEGARFMHILEQTHPVREKVFPIVGVPGFRLEYPYRTYLGNKEALTTSRSWQNVQMVTANCPFAVFYALRGLHRRYPSDTLRVALIGTKPHALGGVLYAISNPQKTELIFDHPIRDKVRTVGRYRTLVYKVSTLVAGHAHT